MNTGSKILSGNDALTANREWIQIDGKPAETLKELWPDKPKAMIIGLNPAIVSVNAGHYYQGQYGQRQMHRLAKAGLFSLDEAVGFCDDEAFTLGIGFADLVRRPTRGEDEVTTSEIAAGAVRIKSELARRHVPLIVSVFRHPAKYLTGLPKKKTVPGFLDLSGMPGTKLFRMPGPTASTASAEHVMSQLRAYLEEQARSE